MSTKTDNHYLTLFSKVQNFRVLHTLCLVFETFPAFAQFIDKRIRNNVAQLCKIYQNI